MFIKNTPIFVGYLLILKNSKVYFSATYESLYSFASVRSKMGASQVSILLNKSTTMPFPTRHVMMILVTIESFQMRYLLFKVLFQGVSEIPEFKRLAFQIYLIK